MRYPRRSRTDQIPLGFRHRHTLSGHLAPVRNIVWAPRGSAIATAADDGTVRLWDTASGAPVLGFQGPAAAPATVQWSPDGQLIACTFGSQYNGIMRADSGELLHSVSLPGKQPAQPNSLAWSPDGHTIAWGTDSGIIQMWHPTEGDLITLRGGHSAPVNAVAWSPNGRVLASASDDGTIVCHDSQRRDTIQHLGGHPAVVSALCWHPSGRLLFSAGADQTVRVWDATDGRHVHVLEGHTQAVYSISFLPYVDLLASKSSDGVIRLWRCDSWEPVAVINEPGPSPRHLPHRGLALHPRAPMLATLGGQDSVVRIWALDLPAILCARPQPHYTNAKVVLVGDTGVGKTGLGLVLAGGDFAPTDSTHGRNVWTFDSQKVDLGDGREQTRETLLWDLAGQPGYRLVHQLHLNEVAAAAIVFDARSETDPLAGVRHWDRALRQAQHLQGDTAIPMKKFLVSARTDRGRVAVSPARIQELVGDLGFDAYFETSAKEGRGIGDLASALRIAIDWDSLPKVSSNELFHTIKAFLLNERKAGRLLSTAHDLHRAFLQSDGAPAGTNDLRDEFSTCIRLLESRDLIRRLSFGDFVLLQPELLDSYASALVNAARDEPEGLGSIAEKAARAGRFRMPEDERIEDREQEEFLLIATVEDLLRHEIALREQAEDGPYLVFPSQFLRDYPEAPDPAGKAVVFTFEGPLMNIYATLCVRLAHSGILAKKEMWRNAAVYTAGVGGECGLWLREVEDGKAELTLFFDSRASEETRFQFEEYIRTHLQRRALPDTIQRRRIFICEECDTPVSDLAAQRRRERDSDWITCNVCDTRISLLDREERLVAARESAVPDMDRAADTARDLAAAASRLQGKIETDGYDVFLCHNSADKPAVKDIGTRLKQLGILPWLDEWELRPGLLWQKALEQRIKTIKAAAVFVGKQGVGPWQDQELQAFLRQFARRECPVIPVLLADAPEPPDLPVFLEGMTWVDFRKDDPDPLEQLI